MQHDEVNFVCGTSEPAHLAEELDPLFCGSVAGSQPEVVELRGVHSLLPDQVVAVVGHSTRPVHSLQVRLVLSWGVDVCEGPVLEGEALHVSPRSRDEDVPVVLSLPIQQARRSRGTRRGRPG